MHEKFVNKTTILVGNNHFSVEFMQSLWSEIKRFSVQFVVNNQTKIIWIDRGIDFITDVISIAFNTKPKEGKGLKQK